VTQQELEARNAAVEAGEPIHRAHVDSDWSTVLPEEYDPLWTDQDYARAKVAIGDRLANEAKTEADPILAAAATEDTPADIRGDDAEEARRMAEWDAAEDRGENP
jgi:hypothetical protein